MSTASRSATSRAPAPTTARRPVRDGRRPSSKAPRPCRLRLAHAGIAASSTSEARASAATLAWRDGRPRRAGLRLRRPTGPQTSAISSAAESPPGPRRASRSEGAPRRADRGSIATRFDGPGRPPPGLRDQSRPTSRGDGRGLGNGTGEAFPGPERRKPADFPRHPDPGTLRSLGTGPYAGLIEDFTHDSWRGSDGLSGSMRDRVEGLQAGLRVPDHRPRRRS